MKHHGDSTANSHFPQSSPLEKIQSAVNSLLPDCEREIWIKVGMALKDGLGENGFQVFDSWSSGGASYNQADCRDAWRSFKPGGGITIKTLFYMARETGWRLTGPIANLPRSQPGDAKSPSVNAEKAMKAAEISQKVLNAARLAGKNAPYLPGKKVSPTKTLYEIPLTRLVEIIGYVPQGKLGQLQGPNILIVPIVVGDQLSTMEMIDNDGRKAALAGGVKKDGYWASHALPGYEGEGLGLDLLVAEGVATSLSGMAAMNGIGIAAFSNGNLLAVARIMQARYPKAKITILADLEKSTRTPDSKAFEAAQILQLPLATPSFGTGILENNTDFNDLQKLYGQDNVRQGILAAKIPEPATGTSTPTGDNLEVIYRQMNTVQAQHIQWLWPNRIAKSKLTLFAGDPGTGKSQTALEAAATVSTGGTWPDGTRCPVVGTVIIISCEDDPGDTIRPRLEAYGADLAKIFILEAISDIDGKGKNRQRGFNLRDDILRLETLIKTIGNVALIIIDPISAYVGDADSYKNSDVRALLAPLTEIAGKYRMTVIAVSHLAKSGSSAMNKISGSLGFIAAARAGYLIGKNPKDANVRLFLPVKNNIGTDQTGFAFRIETVELPSGIQTSKIVWERTPVSMTADELLLAQGESQEDKSALEDAMEVLEDTLKLGPVEAKKVKANAYAAGISERTLLRAKTVLKVKSKKGLVSGKWSWNLPEKKEPLPAKEEKNGKSGEGGHLVPHKIVGDVGNVGSIVSPYAHTNNIYNKLPQNSPKEKQEEGCQGCQDSQENYAHQAGQERNFEEF